MKTPAPSPIPVAFFRRDSVTVARALIGCTLVRQLSSGKRLLARIVETEAYIGPHDLACHASKGKTARTQVMFLPGGVAYVYFIYGMHEMLNFVTGNQDDPQAVLIRAAEPLLTPPNDWPSPPPSLSGPGRLTNALRITRQLNGLSLVSHELHLLPRPAGHRPRILVTPRIGVDYAGPWKHKPLRFFDARSPAVSGPKRSIPAP